MSFRPADRSATSNPVEARVSVHAEILDDEGATTVTGEFDRFETLTRRLVRVPKDELDRKRDEEKARKG